MGFTRPNVDLPAIAELAEHPQWVVWASMVRNGKPTKVPFRPNGVPASATRAATWTTFEEACAAVERGQVCTLRDKTTGEVQEAPAQGVGIVVTERDPYVGVDVDRCINGTGRPSEEARALADRLRSYTEVSPSGTGIRIITRGVALSDGKRKGKVEAYSAKRFLTITGQVLDDWPDEIVEAQEELDRLFRELGAVPKEEAQVHIGDAMAGPLPAGRRFTFEGFTVVIPQNFPSDELLALRDASTRFEQTWNLKRRDLDRRVDGGSPFSTYDMSLAVQCLQAGMDEHKTAAILARFRQRHGNTKWGRDDYLPRTVLSARRFLARGFTERQALDEQAQLEHSSGTLRLPPPPPPPPPSNGPPTGAAGDEESDSGVEEEDDGDPRRKAILGALSARLGDIPVRGILQVGTDPALYFLEVAGGKQVKLGDEKALLSQRAVMGRLLAELRVVMPTLKPAAWAETLALMMEVVEVRNVDQVGFFGQIRELLALYFEHRPIEHLSGEPDGTKPSLAFRKSPFVEHGKLYLHLQDVASLLASHAGFNDPSRLSQFLMAIKYSTTTVYAQKPDGASTSRSYWYGPAEAVLGPEEPAKNPI